MRGQTTLDFAVGVSVFLIVVAFVLAFVPTMLQPFDGSSQEETALADRLAEQLSTGLLVEDVTRPYQLDRECTVIFFESRQDGDDPGGDDAENVDGDTPVSFSAPFGAGTYDGDCAFDDVSFRERLGLTSTVPDVRVSLRADMTVSELDRPDADDDDVNGSDDVASSVDTTPDALCIDTNSANRIVEAGDPFEDNTECDLTGGDDDVLFAIGPTPPTDRDSVVTARRAVSLEGGLGDGTTDATLVVEVW
jgi:hypothetical protein